ncbi:MAG: hypothetical protein Q8P12_00255 [bacterium]|nr:hypothetical protein [bacterium]
MRAVTIWSFGAGFVLLVLSAMVAAPSEEMLQMGLRLAVVSLCLITVGMVAAAASVISHLMGREIW